MEGPPAFRGSESGHVAEPGVFYGTNPDECEEFIANVRTYAKAEGKTRDNTWIADEVYDSFRGRALRWYLKQLVEVRGDWELLQQGMMDEWLREESAPEPPAVAPATLPATSTPSTPGSKKKKKKTANSSSNTATDNMTRRARVKPGVVFVSGITNYHGGDIVEVLDIRGDSCVIRKDNGGTDHLPQKYFQLL